MEFIIESIERMLITTVFAMSSMKRTHLIDVICDLENDLMKRKIEKHYDSTMIELN